MGEPRRGPSPALSGRPSRKREGECELNFHRNRFFAGRRLTDPAPRSAGRVFIPEDAEVRSLFARDDIEVAVRVEID